MPRRQKYIGPRPLTEQPKYVQKAEARRLKNAAQQVIEAVMTAPRPSITTPSPTVRSSPMSFADLQAAVFGPVPFQGQPRRVRRAYDRSYRLKQRRWARKRGDTSWGAGDEERALRWGRSRTRRTATRRRRRGGNRYWTAAAWSGARGSGRTRRPTLRARRRRYSIAASPRRRRYARAASARRTRRFFVPRSCRTKSRRFRAARGIVSSRYSKRKLKSFSRKRRSSVMGRALSQLSAYCSDVRSRRRSRRSSSRRGRSRRGRR
jgi:hypothetical protein